MTTKVKVESIEGNKAIKVLVTWKDGDGKDGSAISILKPTESREFYVHDGQQLQITESGGFLDE